MTQPTGSTSSAAYVQFGPKRKAYFDKSRLVSALAIVFLSGTVIFSIVKMATEDSFTVEETSTVAGSLTKFAASLYEKVARSAKASENVLISPFSVASVLAMAHAGAKGNTAEQLKSSLHLSGHDDAKLSAVLGQLVRGVKGDDQYTLEAANKLFVHEKFSLQPDFQNAMQKYFAAPAESVNFGESAKAAETINKWVEAATRQKIKDLVPQSALNALTRLVLANAVYFKGNWVRKFDSGKTVVQPFYLGSKNDTINVHMMHTDAQYKVGNLRDLDARILELPYLGDRISMFVILPNEYDGLAKVESAVVSGDILSQADNAMRSVKLHVALPKFKIEDSVQLNDALKELGLADLFDENRADLSGISGQKDLYVSDVFHKTFLEVNEEGSEAAAATGMVVMTRMAMIPPPPFEADHPFMFLIRDNVSKLVLFTGRLARPQQA